MKYLANTKDGSFKFNTAENGKLWYNYLWNSTGYVCEVTNTGELTSHRVTDDSQIFKLNEPKCSVIYLRDDDSMRVWNIGVAPTCEAVEDYTCEHAQEYSKISSVFDGIYAEQTVAVAENDTAEVWRVRVCNRSEKARNISVVPYVGFNIIGFEGVGHYTAKTTCETFILKDIDTVLCSCYHPYKTQPRLDTYISAYQSATSFQGRQEDFFSTIGSPAKPLELLRNKTLSGKEAGVRPKCGVIQNRITLAPGEEKTLYYRIGFVDNRDELVSDYEKRKEESIHLFDNIEARGIARFGKLRTETPNENVNRIMNFWAEKQVDYCMIGKKAVRDNAQLALAMLNYDTVLAEKTLTECFEHQFSFGKALLNWIHIESFTYSDPPMWLILAACEYVKESGNFDFLKKIVAYQDGGKGTILEHMQTAVKWYMSPENIGPNGLPRIMHADWNDALNIHDENAESIFMAMGLCWALGEYIDLCTRLGEVDGIEEIKEFRKNLAKTTNDKAWNGTHYVRAFSKFGVVGDQPPVYINPQSWAILADIVPNDRMEILLNSIDKYETVEGIRLCSPPYDSYDEAVGRMSGMRPGVYESGGIYNHACGFKVMADCKIGRGDKALGTLLTMIPDSSEHNSVEITTTEPYVFTNCYLKNRPENMMVGFSWQTGSSAWGLRDFYEGIAGIVREYDGLKISPCMPSAWNEMSITRIYRGNKLNIYYHNQGGKNVKLELDGKATSGDVIRPFADSNEHRIDVYLTN